MCSDRRGGLFSDAVEEDADGSFTFESKSTSTLCMDNNAEKASSMDAVGSIDGSLTEADLNGDCEC